jgi:hypothetical protein
VRLLRSIEACRNAILVRDIDGGKQAANLCSHRFAGLGIEVEQSDFSATIGEQACGCGP